VEKTKRPAGADGALARDHQDAESGDESSARHRHLRVAFADVFEPSGQRRRFLVVVRRCPYCSGAHQHYGQDLADLLDGLKSGCGRPYKLHLSRLVVGSGRVA
jgi:hypothetical protein